MQRLAVGDLVQVIAGKDKGKRGRVTRILSGSQRVVVDGLNKVVRHTRPNQRNSEGGRLSKEAPLHISNVMPIDSASGRPTRVKVAVDEEQGKRRVAVSGADLEQG